MFFLIFNFFIIAFLYSLVGFGGGSSYTALLSVSGIDYTLIPKISLLCNIVVVTGGLYHSYKNGHFRLKLVLPFVITSIPFAFLGAAYKLEEQTFFTILAVSLFLSGLRILFIKEKKDEQITSPHLVISLIIGMILGLLSGLVGIGGGIFLSPLLINMSWARSKEAASVASSFILLNSISGLVGQFYKNSNISDVVNFIPLIFVVLIAGQLGSRLANHNKTSFNLIQKATGILTLFISGKLVIQLIAS